MDAEQLTVPPPVRISGSGISVHVMGGGKERRRGNTSLQPSLLCAAGLINAPDNEI